MSLSSKGPVVLLAGILPALFFFSDALPPRQMAGGSGLLPQFTTPTKTSVPVVGWVTCPSHSAAVRSRSATRQNQQEGRQHSMTHCMGGVTVSFPPPVFARCGLERPSRRICSMLHSVPPGLDGGVGPASSASAAVSHVDSSSAATAGSNSKTIRPGFVEGAGHPSSARGGELLSKQGASTEAAAGRRSRDFFAAPPATPSEALASSTTTTTTTADEEELSIDRLEAVTAVDDNKGEATCALLKGIDRLVEIAGQRVRLRVATLDDYFAIADVRFNVFSPVHSTLKHRFRERSCLLMTERRRRGAFCLVAVLEGAENAGEGGVTGVSEEHVLGTLECSRHEFDGTPLEVEQEAETLPRLYLTEVAVRSDCRRLGVGSILLSFVDDVAKHLNTAEIFLHVNEVNEAALRLYSRCGYEEAPDCASNRVFTNSLGLSGGFIGQRHLVLRKTFD